MVLVGFLWCVFLFMVFELLVISSIGDIVMNEIVYIFIIVFIVDC